MSLTEWYAHTFGISDQEIAEAPWLANWVKNHHNSLRYNHAAFRWFWVKD